MIIAQPVEVKRDKIGMWFHPSFPWGNIPDETKFDPYVKEWGYIVKYVSLDSDAPESVANRYYDSNDPDCSYWEPSKPKGEDWFLGAIYDTEDGPVALWMKSMGNQ